MAKNRRRSFFPGIGMANFLLFVLWFGPAPNYCQFQQFFVQPQSQNYQLQYPNLQYTSSYLDPYNDNKQQKGKGSDSISIRLIDEILEIFVPPNTYAPKRSPSQPPLITYGLNQLLPAVSKSHDVPIPEDSPINFAGSERRFQPQKSYFSSDRGAIASDQQQQAPWANLAQEMLGLFRPLETTTTTTAMSTEMTLLERFMPKIPNLFNSFGGGQTTMTTTTAATPPPTLFPFLSFFTEKPTTTKAAPMPWLSFLRQEQQPKRVDTRANPILEPLGQFFGVEKKAVEEGRAQIDTGGPNNFDRFVVREKMAPDNPFLGFVGGGKWNERGR